MQAGERYRHVKRGTIYTVIGYGSLQTENEQFDDEPVVIYLDAEGKFWVRPIDEFQDGRFVREDAA